VLATASHFHPSTLFTRKFRSLQLGWNTITSSTFVGSRLNVRLWLKWLAMKKRTRLQCCSMGYQHEMCQSTVPWLFEKLEFWRKRIERNCNLKIFSTRQSLVPRLQGVTVWNLFLCFVTVGGTKLECLS